MSQCVKDHDALDARQPIYMGKESYAPASEICACLLSDFQSVICKDVN